MSSEYKERAKGFESIAFSQISTEKQQNSNTVGGKRGSSESNFTISPDLVAVIDAWPKLTPDQREQVRAFVQSLSATSSGVYRNSTTSRKDSNAK